MERKILVSIAVSNEKHANLIKEDIENAVKERTTYYYISEPLADSMNLCSDNFHKKGKKKIKISLVDKL